MIDEIIQLTHECGFVKVTTQDVAELLDGHDNPLSNQELEELVEILDNPQLKSVEEDDVEDRNEKNF